uniref:Uncharacterized protein n=1 Tax=Arion vulgaris TaxID=1028688 RepID=A0A0B6ZEN8_9EUPU
MILRHTLKKFLIIIIRDVYTGTHTADKMRNTSKYATPALHPPKINKILRQNKKENERLNKKKLLRNE